MTDSNFWLHFFKKKIGKDFEKQAEEEKRFQEKLKAKKILETLNSKT